MNYPRLLWNLYRQKQNTKKQTFWHCDGVTMEQVTAKGDYFAKKKISALFIVLCCLFPLAACNSKGTEQIPTDMEAAVLQRYSLFLLTQNKESTIQKFFLKPFQK